MKLVIENTEKIVDYYEKAKEKQEIYRDITIKGKGTRPLKLHHYSEKRKDNSGEQQ